MHVTRWATGVIFCALAFTPIAAAQQATAPPDAAKLPPPAAKYEKIWPKTLPQATAEAQPKPSTEWSKQEIELAEARCTALLKGLDVVALPDPPIREGTDCGTPAPMRLVSIGSNPQIAFSPPPALTCDMITALHRWLQRDVQPLAHKHLGAPIVRVATMSSYSCRNAYSRKSGRLSEHGRVNALDISAFITTRGQTAMVVADWGPIAREIAAKAAAAQKQREAEAEAAAKQQNLAPAEMETPAAVATQQPLRPSISIEVPGITTPLSRPDVVFGLTQPNRLGGPKEGDKVEPALPPALTGKAQFLRAVHHAACGVFGTVLGPEANNAHKNHFHVDMAERKHGSICE